MAEKKPAAGKKQDPRVARLRPDPKQPSERTRALSGLWGDSDRDGFQRLYLTSSLDVYAEFRVDDLIDVVDIPPESAPFVGEPSTRVELRNDAHVDFTHSRRVGDVDEFDLDVRFGRGPVRMLAESLPASSDLDACMKPGQAITDPCNSYTCDAWVCHTSLFAGRRCGETPFGPEHTRFRCPSEGCVPNATGPTCETCPGLTQCGTCYTNFHQTQCGGCYTEPGYTQCGTCYTDQGQTDCGGCVPRRGG